MMQVNRLGLGDVVELVPDRFQDDRGFFSEVYNRKRFEELGIPDEFVQDNASLSTRAGIVRGLHYQLAPRAQGKLVRVTQGEIFDVAVDIRRSSPTFGRWVGIHISASKWNQVYIPKGFAHGFMAIAPETEVVYKVTDFYSGPHERSIRFDDPELAIDWPLPVGAAHLSAKDRAAPGLAEAETFE